MNDNTKLETAVEIMAAKIALCTKNGYTLKSREMRTLINEREEMYKGNEKIINKIIEVYGQELKKDYLKI